MNTQLSPQIYDAIVVGSGATGGVAAKELAERGLQVLVLEAGRNLSPQVARGTAASNMVKRFYNLAISRHQSVQAKHPGYWKANPDLFTDEKANPYTYPENKPFYWTRGRQVGGRSLTWGGITLRLSDYEFKAASHDGWGQDWPIAYADLAPYYSHLERFLGVQGACNGLPQLPDGQYQGVPALTPAETYLQQVVSTHWSDRRLIPSRGFPLHKATADDPWPRSCSQGASLKAALATRRVTLQSNAIASHLIFDRDTHKARGVGYIDRITKTAGEVFGRIVVLCASTIESVRILLNSTEERQSGGLSNQSGLLGRYLMDHISVSSFFFLPGIAAPKTLFELSGCNSFFIPRFTNLDGSTEEFLRGYGLWGGAQRFDPPGVFRKVGSGAIGFMIGHGEVLPQFENRVSLDAAVVDAWGIPVPHIDCAWSNNERLMAMHIRREIEAIVAKAGGECMGLTELFHMPAMSGSIQAFEKETALAAPPGYYIHEVGGARMGTSPENSVVNATNQCWEAENVLVTDGACWASAGWQSPTLTEMAITARACDRIAEALRLGEV